MSLAEVVEWGKGKPMALVAFAVAVADFAQIAKEYSDMLASGRPWHVLQPCESVKQWLRFYKRHDLVMGVGAEALGIDAKTAVQGFRAVHAAERAWVNTPRTERERIAGELVQDPEVLKDVHDVAKDFVGLLNEQLREIDDNIHGRKRK